MRAVRGGARHRGGPPQRAAGPSGRPDDGADGADGADRQHRPGIRGRTGGGAAPARPGAQRLPRPGAVVRRGGLRARGDAAALPPPADAGRGPADPRRPATLAAVQRQVVEVARHKDRLLAAGQHLKRGLLLYGPPGVGKTHTVRYLDRPASTGTTVVAADRQRDAPDRRGLLGRPGAAAGDGRRSRTSTSSPRTAACTPVSTRCCSSCSTRWTGWPRTPTSSFVLTTNRADLLEPALAARPGRVDQAVELDAAGP